VSYRRKPRENPTCATHEQLLRDLAREAQEQQWILAQWCAAAGPRAYTPDPQTRVKLDPDPAPAWETGTPLTWKARIREQNARL
jgi:hypothetical protein